MSGFILKIEELKLKSFRRELGDVSVSECIELAQQADNYLAGMNAFDPAWQKFKHDSRMWWQFAWLLSCEHGTMCPNDPHVKYRQFLVAFPKKQSLLDDCIFRDWLRDKKTPEITMDFSAWLPVYLREDEINGYAVAVFHKQNDIAGRLQNLEMLELEEDV